jgi:hypothetical protein
LRFLSHALLAALLVTSAQDIALAQTVHAAASITYQCTARPDAVPSTFRAGPRERLRFLHIATLDGYRASAALWEPRGQLPARTTIIVGDHGRGDDYYSMPQSFLAEGLARRGYAFLSL